MSMFNTDDIIATMKIRLSKKRFTHSINVADAAKRLAEHYGDDIEKCYVAGLVHDICKEIPHPEQLAMAKSCGLDFSKEEEYAPQLYHAPAAAYYAKEVMNITDESIITAVWYLKICCDNMDLTGEILFLADLISIERDYKDADKMRKIAFSDIDQAMLEALRFQIPDVVKKCSMLPLQTVRAYNYYIKLTEER